MIVKYLILVGIFQLSFTQRIAHKVRTVRHDLTDPLSLDQANVILRNTNSSNSVSLFGNKIVCERCELEELITVDPYDDDTLIIDTKYAYDLELRSWPYNTSVICKRTSFQFGEHGTYVIDTAKVIEATNDCTIEQIGDSSDYLTPAICGIAFVILYTMVVQFLPHFYRSRYVFHFRTRILHQRLVDDTPGIVGVAQEPTTINTTNEDSIADNIANTNRFAQTSVARVPAAGANTKKALPKRLRALDTFRGFSLMIMIFVNYGGGGYWFFDHSTWNGLTLADLVFPWFTWMMGVSIVLSQRSLLSKNVRKRSILLKILRRTAILFILGITGNDNVTLKEVRIPGVLQRLAICYCITAILVLIFDKKDNERETLKLPRDGDVARPLRIEVFKSVAQYWMQWLIVILINLIWILLTFLLPVPGCPTGYIGPGGNHDHGKHQNCTGGAAGYIDRVILGPSHLYQWPTCQDIYATEIPYDPEGIIGNLTGVLLCYLGVQAAHIFVHSTRTRRIYAQWLVAGIICGALGLILSQGGHSNSWIPINKNLWSLTFVLILSSLAFIILTVLYLVVDVRQWFTGAPFLWLGMNSIVIYVCHERFGSSFPVQFNVKSTHGAQLAMNLYGAILWSLIAGYMYYKKFFIAI